MTLFSSSVREHCIGQINQDWKDKPIKLILVQLTDKSTINSVAGQTVFIYNFQTNPYLFAFVNPLYMDNRNVDRAAVSGGTGVYNVL